MRLLIHTLLMFALILPMGCDKDKAEQKTKIVQPKGKIIKYGLFDAIRKGKIRDDPNTTTGKAYSKITLQHLEQTDRIPLKLGTYFAYHYRVFDIPKEAVYANSVTFKRVLIHPEMTKPDGTKTTGSTYTIKRKISVGPQAIAYDGYAFDEKYELVEGDWIFQLWLGDKKVIEQKFITYWPDEKKDNKTMTEKPERI